MSALPPKADMFSVEIDVCFVPLTDIREALAVSSLPSLLVLRRLDYSFPNR